VLGARAGSSLVHHRKITGLFLIASKENFTISERLQRPALSLFNLFDVVHRALLLGDCRFLREAIRRRRKAWVGFDWVFFGTILTEGDFYANTLVTPIVAREAPAFLDSPLSGFLQVWLPFSFTVLAFS
jgi:hypothetical protein